MRQIKFRAKRIDTNVWVYGYYFVTPLTEENSGTTPDKGWYFLTGIRRHCISQDGVVYVIDEETLCQFTGLLDRNGKEIYEKDIVRLHCGGFDANIITATIEWVDKYANFRAHIHDKKIKVKGGSHDGQMISMREVHVWSGMHTCLQEAWGHIEVLGNTNQNPELLHA